MFKVSFSDGLAIAGIAMTIVLVVLDKAGKLKSGPMLLLLLAVAALMTLPLVLGNSWVSEAQPGMLKFTRGMLMFFLVGVIYSLVAIWISPTETKMTPQVATRQASPPVEPEKLEPKPLLPTVSTGMLKTPARESARIEIAPSFGNLKTRCIVLSQQIAQLVRHRYDQLQNQDVYPRRLTPERHREWIKSNDVQFRPKYLSQVRSIRDELAQLHIRDERLDAILERDEENTRLRELHPQQIPEAMGWMDIHDIQTIGERLAILAEQVPQT